MSKRKLFGKKSAQKKSKKVADIDLKWEDEDIVSNDSDESDNGIIDKEDAIVDIESAEKKRKRFYFAIFFWMAFYSILPNRLAQEYLASMNADGDDDDDESRFSDSEHNKSISERLRKERLKEQGKYFRFRFTRPL